MSYRLLQGDALDVLETLEPQSVHCVVTSPPYWGLRDYGTDGSVAMSDATVAADYGCTIYQLRRHRKAGHKYCKRCKAWKPAEEYPLGGGPNSKRGRWCCACVEKHSQATLEAEARATPEMRAAMHELLSLVTGQEPCTRTPNVVTGIGESLNV